MTRFVQKLLWQVEYYERGIQYWWDYPAETQLQLDNLYQSAGDDPTKYVEFQHDYGEISWHPRGSVAEEDDNPRKRTRKMSMYHLFPGKRQQVNLKDNNVRPMRRALVEVERAHESSL